MRIVDIRETTITLASPIRNAEIRFDAMTASAIALVTDHMVGGKPVIGLGFDSIGRYGHGGLLKERFAPRVLAAAPEDYQDATGLIDPEKLWSVAMRNEKPGGHGERAGAVGLLDAAAWDAVAKAQGRPLWHVLAERYNGGAAPGAIPVYGSGGHYRDGDDGAALADELRLYQRKGHTRFKVKIGGLPAEDDRRRLEAALAVSGREGQLAVDGSGTFGREKAFGIARMLADCGVAWFEEPVDPLDFELHRELAAVSPVPIATGENLFAVAETRNMLRYGGLKPERDWLQMDVSLSYGVPEFFRMVRDAEQQGWSRRRFVPHAGHLFSFHTVAGLGLGMHEGAGDESTPFGGYPEGVAVQGGSVTPWDFPGVGFERKPNVYAIFRKLLD